MLTHLYATYAQIKQGELEENDRRMKQDWDPNQPFEVLIDQIEDSVAYAAAEDMPYTVPQVVNTAYNIIFRAGMFTDECKVWRKKASVYKTWRNFKKGVQCGTHGLARVYNHRTYRGIQSGKLCSHTGR